MAGTPGWGEERHVIDYPVALWKFALGERSLRSDIYRLEGKEQKLRSFLQRL